MGVVKENVGSPRGVAYKHERGSLASILQQYVKFLDDLIRCSRHRPGIAPAISRPVIGADAREHRDARLHKVPARCGHLTARLQNNSGTPTARAVDIESVAADVDRPPFLMEAPGVSSRLDCLVQDSRYYEYQHDGSNRQHNVAEPVR